MTKALSGVEVAGVDGSRGKCTGWQSHSVLKLS